MPQICDITPWSNWVAGSELFGNLCGGLASARPSARNSTRRRCAHSWLRGSASSAEEILDADAPARHDIVPGKFIVLG